MADLKRMDLVHFEGIPHLVKEIEGIPTGIVIEDKQIIPMLKWLEKENNRRQLLFASEGVHDLASWNRRKRSDHLPRIVFFADELARLMRNKNTAKEFTELTYDLASTGRATGMYLVVSTQYPKDKYISTDIKLNLPGRMCFSVPDLPASVSMIETGEAVNLYPPPGRGIFSHGVNKYKFQSPFISDGQLKEIVKNAIEGKTSTKLARATELTHDEIVAWSLTENNGFLNARDAFREFSGRMEWNELVKMLNEMDNKIYPFGEQQYRVVPPAGQRARQLELDNSNKSILPPGKASPTEPINAEKRIEPILCPHCGASREYDPCEFCGVE
jgi:DNA segregation ATPase FtsK/SpoIIIE-like protein